MLADVVNKGLMYVNTDDPSLRTRIIEELEQVKALDTSGGRLGVVPKNRV